MYFNKSNFIESFRWLQKAAEQGLANSQAHLGIYYNLDKSLPGLPRDVVKGCAWLTVAVANGCHQVAENLAKSAAALGPEQKAAVKKLSAELLETLPKIPLRQHAERVGLV